MKKVTLSLFLTGICCLMQSQQLYTPVTVLAERSNMRSDRRPISVGYYDKDVNKTFLSWMSDDSHPVVKAYDHTAKQWSENKIVARSPFVDKHNYPGILKGPDGKIYLFYGCHNSTLKMAVSPQAGSLEGEWEDVFIGEAERASYPAPVLTENNVFYVFYRDTRRTNSHSDDRPYQFVKSADNGKTWSRQMAIDPYPRITDNMTEVYNGQVTYQPARGDQKERIHIAWTICGEKLGKHAHATYGRNVYYAYLDPSNDHLYNAAGTDLGQTIDHLEADKYCLALETPIPEKGHSAGLQVSVHYKDDSSPLIHFQYPEEKGGRLAIWTGDKWIYTSIQAQGEPRGIEKIGPESFRIYSTMGKGANVFVTHDGGVTVKKEAEIETPRSLSRCYWIDHALPELKLLMFSTPPAGAVQKLAVADRDVYVTGVASNYSPRYEQLDGKMKPLMPEHFKAERMPSEYYLTWISSKNTSAYRIEKKAGDKWELVAVVSSGTGKYSYVPDEKEKNSSLQFRICGLNSYLSSDYKTASVMK